MQSRGDTWKLPFGEKLKTFGVGGACRVDRAHPRLQVAQLRHGQRLACPVTQPREVSSGANDAAPGVPGVARSQLGLREKEAGQGCRPVLLPLLLRIHHLFEGVGGLLIVSSQEQQIAGTLPRLRAAQCVGGADKELLGACIFLPCLVQIVESQSKIRRRESELGAQPSVRIRSGKRRLGIAERRERHLKLARRGLCRGCVLLGPRQRR